VLDADRERYHRVSSGAPAMSAAADASTGRQGLSERRHGRQAGREAGQRAHLPSPAASRFVGMRYGFVMPAGDAADAADLAVEAESAGWDGFFAYEPTWGVDAWVSLTAAAMRTSTIRLGTMLTPLPKRKPWEVASQAATLDRLSGGRVILSVGLGAPESRFYMFEDDPGRKVRAEMLDEGLAMLALMWRGEPFEFSGRHYRAHRPEIMVPAPSHQQPRVRTWVVGLWPAPRSMRRSARWDGWLPNVRGTDGPGEPEPGQIAEAVAWVRDERARSGLSMDGYDVILEGTTEPGPAAVEEAQSWAEVGATWWIEANWQVPAEEAVAASRERLRAGPPRP
jgi:alkanesulfonate monooxygenase SsuD/methylene tetrahydromethanopterin reductase-like flavin-dependent oxidoreductase (luciferase family)